MQLINVVVDKTRKELKQCIAEQIKQDYADVFEGATQKKSFHSFLWTPQKRASRLAKARHYSTGW